MQKNYFLLALTFCAGISFAQDVLIHVDGEPNVLYNGDTVEVTGSGTQVYKELYILNNTGVSAGYKWRRVKLSTTSTSFTDELCDDQLCWICSGDPWTRPSFWTIAAGDSTLFKPILTTGGAAGAAHYRYYVLDGSETIIDSVDVKFSSVLSTNAIAEEVEYKVYPNPASEIVNITLSSHSPNAQFVLYNVLGSEVSRRNLVHGVNTISVESLDNGVYFYSILQNNIIIETKKLIVKH